MTGAVSFECGKWHAWQGTQFMLSDESTKTLRAFASIDDCINWLWFADNVAARKQLFLRDT